MILRLVPCDYEISSLTISFRDILLTSHPSHQLHRDIDNYYICEDEKPVFWETNLRQGAENIPNRNTLKMVGFP